MTTETKQYQEAIELQAQQIVSSVMGGTTVDRDLNRRAAELLLQKINEGSTANTEQQEQRRLARLTHNEFARDCRQKYGI